MRFLKISHQVCQIVLGAGFLGVLAACTATNPATGQRELAFMNEQQEFETGREIAAEAIKEFGGLYKEKPELNTYLAARVNEIRSVSERPDKQFEARLLDDPILNAFATPGYTMMSRGMLPFLHNEAQLVAVLGHEVGHVTARHQVSRHAKGTLAQLGAIGLGVLLSSQGASAQAAQLTQQAYGIGAGLFFADYSRTHEHEADTLGLRYMSKLGYDPHQAQGVFRSFQRYHNLRKQQAAALGQPMNDDTLFHRLLRSHPEDEARIQKLATEAEQQTATGRRMQRERYLDMIDGIAFGPKPENGIYTKHRYLNPKLGIGVIYTPDFFLSWEPGLPVAFVPGQRVFADILYLPVPKEQDAEETLIYEFPQAQNITRVGKAYRATHTRENLLCGGQQRCSPHRLTLFAFEGAAVDGLKTESTEGKHGIYILLFAAPEPQADGWQQRFTQIADSFRFLTSAERARLQPLRLKIHTVKAGETQESLAGKLPTNGFSLELFRALNGFQAGDKLFEGMQVKIITDPNTSK